MRCHISREKRLNVGLLGGRIRYRELGRISLRNQQYKRAWSTWRNLGYRSGKRINRYKGCRRHQWKSIDADRSLDLMGRYSQSKERPIRFKSERFLLFKGQKIVSREPYTVVLPIFSFNIQLWMKVRKLIWSSEINLTKWSLVRRNQRE